MSRALPQFCVNHVTLIEMQSIYFKTNEHDQSKSKSIGLLDLTEQASLGDHWQRTLSMAAQNSCVLSILLPVYVHVCDASTMQRSVIYR